MTNIGKKIDTSSDEHNKNTVFGVHVQKKGILKASGDI
jgi:hypothetical protein